jgi:hypothetical protein
LLRARRAHRASALALAVHLSGCAPLPEGDAGTDAATPVELAAERVIEYLAITTDELGLDVVTSLQIYAAMRAHARAAEVAELRTATLRPTELERYGELLDIEKTPFPAGSIDDAAPDLAPPNPTDELEDDRSSRCLEEVLACEVASDCAEFLALEGRGGYVLTHQAAALLFARWTDCALPVDVDARRLAIAARLAAEMRADPIASELAYERLAMLGHLGFAGAIEPGWWTVLLESQRDEGCFAVAADRPCHPHPSGVALWALAHSP